MGTKVWIIIAIALLLIGAVTFTIVMTVYEWDFNKLTTVEYVENVYELTDDFINISVDCVTDDIEFMPSEDNTCKVVCVEQTENPHVVSIEDNTLKVSQNDLKWYKNIGISTASPKITIYLPKTGFKSITDDKITGDTALGFFSANNLSISVTTGDVSISNFVCEDLDIRIITGDIFLKNILCKNLNSTGVTGDIDLESVLADGNLQISRTTGDIRFDCCDANDLKINITSGDVTGTLWSEKKFIASTTTGDVDVPASIKGGKCEITSTTGDIKISLVNN